MSARWAAALLGSVGLHVAALALLTVVAVKAGFPPALVVDLSAWEAASPEGSAGAGARGASGDGPARRAGQAARASDPAPIPGSAPASPAGAPMAPGAPASVPAAPASAIAPVPAAGPGETRPSRALAGSAEVVRPRERHAAPLEASSGAFLPRRADADAGSSASQPAGVSDGTLGSSAPGAQVASSGPRTESGAGIGAAGGGATGVAPGGRDGGKGLGVSGGSRLALALPGEGRGGVPAEYGPYLARFRQRVQDALVYPLAARRRGLSGAVELEVLIDPGGRVQNVAVSSSSSHALLDEAAADTVRQMAPVPMPETLPARPLRVKLPLVFELR